MPAIFFSPLKVPSQNPLLKSKRSKGFTRVFFVVTVLIFNTILFIFVQIDLDNYIPDPSKSNDLRRRLYDSGISNIPMPSVKRPIEENISSKPFSAKMNSSK